MSSHKIGEVLRDFRKLNTREARAAYADHWIGLWARDFDEAWPMLYDLLKLVEEEQLYKDPVRVGPRAPGYPKDDHAKQSSYPDFAAYFTERIKRPFDHWAELERVHHYAQKYAPEIFKLPFNEAKNLAPAKHAGPGRGKKTADNISGFRHGTEVGYITARLKRDGHAELLQKVERGETSAHAVAVELGWRTRMVQHPATVEGFLRAIERHLTPEQRRELKGSLGA